MPRLRPAFLLFALLGIHSDAHATACTPPTFILEWGSTGSAPGQFNLVNGLAVGAAGQLYAGDFLNDRVQVFSPDGALLAVWTDAGGEPLVRPYGIAVGPDGRVFISDFRHRIRVFTSEGVFLDAWGESGSGDGQLRSPVGVAVDKSGNVYVADHGNSRIQKFTDEELYLAHWGAGGYAGIAVSDDGMVYAADFVNQRIQKFTSDGSPVTQWGAPGSGEGEFNNPLFLSVSSNGFVDVTDNQNQRVQRFTTDGSYCTQWGGEGTWDVDFTSLTGWFSTSEGSAIRLASARWSSR